MLAEPTVALVLVVFGVGLLFLALGGEIKGFGLPKPTPKWMSFSTGFLGVLCLLGAATLGLTSLRTNGQPSQVEANAPKQEASHKATSEEAAPSAAGSAPAVTTSNVSAFNGSAAAGRDMTNVTIGR